MPGSLISALWDVVQLGDRATLSTQLVLINILQTLEMRLRVLAAFMNGRNI